MGIKKKLKKVVFFIFISIPVLSFAIEPCITGEGGQWAYKTTFTCLLTESTSYGAPYVYFAEARYMNCSVTAQNNNNTNTGYYIDYLDKNHNDRKISAPFSPTINFQISDGVEGVGPGYEIDSVIGATDKTSLYPAIIHCDLYNFDSAKTHL